MLLDKQLKSSRESQRFEKDRRPKCNNCGKRGHLQVDCREKKIPIEESDRTNWKSKAPEQHTVSTLHKTSGNLIFSVHINDKETQIISLKSKFEKTSTWCSITL